MPEYVIVNTMADDPRSTVHIVREYGESMRTITECGRHLFHPVFTEASETRLCLNCQRKVEE